MWARKQVLMYPNGPVELTASAHDRTEREVCVDRISIGRQRFDESVYVELRTVFEQEIDALEVIAAEIGDATNSAARALAPAEHESEPDRDDEDDVEVYVFEHQPARTRSSSL